MFMNTKSTSNKLWSRLLVGAVALATVVLAVGATAQRQARYHFGSVDAPGAIYFTGILGINNRGDIAGVRDGDDGRGHGFVRINGKYKTIDFPGATDSNAANITDNGVVTGTYFGTDGLQHGFKWQDGKYDSIDVPGAAHIMNGDFEFGPGLGTNALRMNDRGAVVGEYADAAGFSHGYVYGRGKFHTLDAPGASHQLGLGTEAIGINNSGAITGVYYLDNSTAGHGFLLMDGEFFKLDCPWGVGKVGSQPNGINNRGMVCGPYGDKDDHIHGYLWFEGEFRHLDYPKAPDSECDALNDDCVAVGQYTDAIGITHGYIATPKE
jgi:uncharacterized membrane protein